MEKTMAVLFIVNSHVWSETGWEYVLKLNSFLF